MIISMLTPNYAQLKMNIHNSYGKQNAEKVCHSEKSLFSIFHIYLDNIITVQAGDDIISETPSPCWRC